MKKDNEQNEAATGRIAQMAQDARKLYAGDTMCCSEAVLTVLNREFQGGLPQNIVISMAKGFCGGIGDAGCLCGAVAGAIMGQGLILGQGPIPAEEKLVRAASREFHRRFIERHRSTCCRVLTRRRKREGPEAGVECAQLVESACAISAELLTEYRNSTLHVQEQPETPKAGKMDASATQPERNAT